MERLIFGYFGFLVALGFGIKEFAFADGCVIVIVFYGGMIWGILPMYPAFRGKPLLRIDRRHSGGASFCIPILFGEQVFADGPPDRPESVQILCEKVLFHDVGFSVEERDRIALIGVNGSGKTTLLRVLAGAEPPDTGFLTLRQDLRVEYLPQNPPFRTGDTVLDYVFSNESEETRLIGDYEATCAALERDSDAAQHERLLKRLESLMARMQATGA
jgi:hypothetical protein